MISEWKNIDDNTIEITGGYTGDYKNESGGITL